MVGKLTAYHEEAAEWEVQVRESYYSASALFNWY